LYGKEKENESKKNEKHAEVSEIPEGWKGNGNSGASEWSATAERFNA
jgi:hypothetical protein